MISREYFLKILVGGAEVAVKCKRCGSEQVRTWEHQTRGSDEPRTIFHKCLKCKFVTCDHGN